MRVSVLGATGAMGGSVIKCALQDGHSIVNKVSSKDNISMLFRRADVVIDFSCPVATEAMLRHIYDRKVNTPIVVGTTGLSKLHINLMRQCAEFTSIFSTPNMSVLVALTNVIVYELAQLLDEDFEVEISETHHRLKKDAPSGTAIMLGKTVAEARKQNFSDVANFARFGIVDPRKRGEIGFSVKRCGRVNGIHSVDFINDNECISIRHEAFSREIFARGAVSAAKWVFQQKPGFYNMTDLTKEAVTPVLNNIINSLFTSST
ncbi:MAG: 4-hydroxy-tetrahydrodipicolinate reductase [Holosporales bacterium]|jgi:4-hydroxy-tetrahydrodipicolinate reductase|nr:4-hydroxy-tetrahydrodipicolinate reductase [Holosporales bacterium]